MIKVAIEAPSKTARFAVGVRAQSLQKALCIVAARYPKSLVTVKFPIYREGSSRMQLEAPIESITWR